MLPSPDGTSFTIAGPSGLPSEYIMRVNQNRRIRLEPDDSRDAPASRTFRSGRPSSVTDIAAESSYRSTAHKFLSDEVEQLELLAEHAANALTSARILDDLREQHRLIMRSAQIHDRLVRVAARSGGVSGITTALHDLLGCDVVVHDVNGEILATQENVPVLPRLTPWRRCTTQRSGPRSTPPSSSRSKLLRQRSTAEVEVEQTLRGEPLADLVAEAQDTSGAATVLMFQGLVCVQAEMRDVDHRLNSFHSVGESENSSEDSGEVPGPSGRGQHRSIHRVP